MNLCENYTSDFDECLITKGTAGKRTRPTSEPYIFLESYQL